MIGLYLTFLFLFCVIFQECQEENATRRQELPLPFVVCYDGCYTSSSLNKINYDGNKESSKSRENMHHQTFSDRFCDQPGQQNFDIDNIAFQPPPEKVRKLGENLDGRKGGFRSMT